MAKPPPAPPRLPPPTRRQVWVTFLTWALGVPAVVVAGLAVIWGALALTGSQGLMPQAESDMGTALLWMAAIVLIYPVALVFLLLDLRDGLRAARDWAAMTEAERQAALAAQAAAPGPRRSAKRGRR
ncbi:MAG: hypothetical protein KBF78_17175 [Fuscovulum sp.]|nr:hypothetical protein [Fuscovulum sp.]